MIVRMKAPSHTPTDKEQAVPRILSGVQPTGNTHLGNYVGANQWDGHAAEAGA